MPTQLSFEPVGSSSAGFPSGFTTFRPGNLSRRRNLVLSTSTWTSPKAKGLAKNGALLALSKTSPTWFARLRKTCICSWTLQVALARLGIPIPSPVLSILQVASSFIKPVLAMTLLGAFQALRSLRAPHKRTQQINDPTLVEALSHDHAPPNVVVTNAPKDGTTQIQQVQGATAAELAATYHQELTVLQLMLDREGITLPLNRRRQPAELMRFAVCNGILQAETAEARMAVLQDTVAHLKRHCEWHTEMDFLPAHEVKEWEQFCRVSGFYEGTVLIELDIGKLLQREHVALRPRFNCAVMSLLEVAISNWLSDDGSKPSTLTAVIHVGNVSLIEVFQCVRLGTSIVRTLKNYPGRLTKLYVVDLPTSAQWFLTTMLRFVSPVTQRKIVVCSSKDPNAVIPTPSLTPTPTPAPLDTAGSTIPSGLSPLEVAEHNEKVRALQSHPLVVPRSSRQGSRQHSGAHSSRHDFTTDSASSSPRGTTHGEQLPRDPHTSLRSISEGPISHHCRSNRRPRATRERSRAPHHNAPQEHQRRSQDRFVSHHRGRPVRGSGGSRGLTAGLSRLADEMAMDAREEPHGSTRASRGSLRRPSLHVLTRDDSAQTVPSRRGSTTGESCWGFSDGLESERSLAVDGQGPPSSSVSPANQVHSDRSVAEASQEALRAWLKLVLGGGGWHNGLVAEALIALVLLTLFCEIFLPLQASRGLVALLGTPG